MRDPPAHPARDAGSGQPGGGESGSGTHDDSSSDRVLFDENGVPG